ncbi:MAG: aminotransferase class I/II-fold pyridoxal phosphate-dependent enzyme [Pseudomonadota bacterium]
MKESRQHERKKFFPNIKVKSTLNQKSYQVNNISLGGLSLTGDDNFSLKNIYELDLFLPFTKETINFKGEVVYNSQIETELNETENQQHLIGIKFTEIAHYNELHDFFEKYNLDPYCNFLDYVENENALSDKTVSNLSDARRVLKIIKNDLKNDVYPFHQPIDQISGTKVIIRGEERLNLASYNYLSLGQDPRFLDVITSAVKEYGTTASGSRLLSGTFNLHLKLEKLIADYKQTEAATIFSSGYVANISTISSIMGKKDLIIVDKFDHMSILDGCKLSGSTVVKFDHNNLDELEEILKTSQDYEKKLIIVDAIYSMGGDIAPIKEILDLKKKYDALLMIDEAHAFGILGKTGRGLSEHFNLDVKDIDIYMGTLSKAVPSVGGYIAGSKDLVYYLQHSSNAYIFSGSLSPQDVAVSTKALEIMRSEPERIEKLWENINFFKKGIQEIGFDTQESNSAIIPAVIGFSEETLKFAKRLNENGLFVCSVTYPAVPIDKCIIRNCVQTNHSKEDLEKAIDIFSKIGKEMKLI